MPLLKTILATLLVIGGALLLIFFPHSKEITDSEYTNKTGFTVPVMLCGLGLPGINYSAIAEQRGFPLATQSKYYFQDDCENNITIRSSVSGAIINGIVGALVGTIIFLSGYRLSKRIFK